MVGTAFLAPLTGSECVRRVVDAASLRYAHRRVAALDRMDVARVQGDTLMKLTRTARDTNFGRDHDFARIRSVTDYQARVGVHDYEWFWGNYWKHTFPGFANATWPGQVPYYALSSGTTSGTTKYIPVSREMVRSNKKAAFTTVALFRHANPTAKLFTGKFFLLGGSTDLRKQADGSLAGDISGIAAKELPGMMQPYAFPPPELASLTDWEEKVRRSAAPASASRRSAASPRGCTRCSSTSRK